MKKKKTKTRRATKKRVVVEKKSASTSAISVRNLVGPTRLDQALYDTTVGCVATRVQSLWMEQHPGETPDMQSRVLEVKFDTRAIGDMATEVATTLSRMLDSMSVRA